MLGAIIGDIIGSAYEFNPTNDYNFKLFPENANFTDDTICTIAIADALLNGRDFGESLHEWCRKYPNPKGGYGGRFAKWIKSDNPRPYNSFGNGSAMRVSPIGWWANNPEDLLRLATQSAECTHNHEKGIEGAQAVAAAILDCRDWMQNRRSLIDQNIYPSTILDNGIQHALSILGYGLYISGFNLNLEKYRNRFDVTCEGTVPVALYIVMTSHSFEDAIRKAVSLGADADTLAAIVGSIAEVIWGIPERIKAKALSYLPKEMLDVVKNFNARLKELRYISRYCEYYKYTQFRGPDEKHLMAYNIEYRWAHEISRHSILIDEKLKQEMLLLAEPEWWESWAKRYDMPYSLIGYLFKYSMPNYRMTKANQKHFAKFMQDNYSQREKFVLEKIAKKLEYDQKKVLEQWVVGLGNSAKRMEGQNPMPPKNVITTAESWEIQPMPRHGTKKIPAAIFLSDIEMKILKYGHLPEVMEDHWFMYCTDNSIRYYRSWTGIPIYYAKYQKLRDGYLITELEINYNNIKEEYHDDTESYNLFKSLIRDEVGAISSYFEQ